VRFVSNNKSGDGGVTMKEKKKIIYFGVVELFIACKWAYYCKTWLGMCTPGKSSVKSRHRPR
jgi:hypothetical protein